MAAQRAKVQVTFAVAMANHWHGGIHDSEGNHPVFTEHFHGLLARCQNAHLGRFENFWSSDPTSIVRLVEPNDVLEKMVYAFTNPSAADLVETVEEWPGVTTFQATIAGGNITATRPKHFFRDDGSMPEVVSMPISRPRGFEHLSQGEWASLVTERVRAKEAAHRQRRKETGNPVLGREAILRQSPVHCPSSHAPRFKLSPKFAAKNKWARIEAILRNRVFNQRYRAAIVAHMAGLANVVFPFGTYWMKKVGKVICETAEMAVAAMQASPLEPAPS